MNIDLWQAKERLSYLLERTMAGEEITIVQDGRAVVRMLPVPGAAGTLSGSEDENEMGDYFADALGG